METCRDFITSVTNLFITGLIATLPHSLFSPMILLGLLSLTMAITFFLIQIYKTYRYLRSILRNKVASTKKISEIALKLGIENKLVVAKEGNFSSFVFGLLSPKICLNQSFANSLTSKELEAVLLHEKHHLKNKDPLKILITQTLQSLLLFLPVFRDLQNHYLLSQEVAADRAVLKNAGVFVLRNALIKSISLPGNNFALARLSAEQSFEQRIKILTAKSSGITLSISGFRLITSVLAVVFYLFIANLPIYAIDHKDDHEFYLCVSNKRIFTPATYSPKD